MQKKLTATLAAAALMLSLSACGGSKADSVTNPTPTQTAATQAAPETTAPAVTFQETIIVDNEDCTFLVKGIETNNLWGYTLSVQLENKTDKDLMFSLQDTSVNGFMCDPFWAATVTAGMKANEEIHFSQSDFERNGITNVTAIESTLRVYDSNDWTAEDVVNKSFFLHPLGEEAVEVYTRTPVDGEIVLFDNENSSMIVTGFDPDNTWGYTVNVYLENKTDKALMFSISDAAVNGFMCDPLWAASVAPGKRSNTTISWMASDFEDNGITEVESLTLPIRVYDENDWLSDDLVSETFTVTP